MITNTSFNIFQFFFLCQLYNAKGDDQQQQQDEWNLDYGSNLIDVDESPKIECPADFTGQIAYAMDCRQFLNCYKGRGSIQSCSPGTMFNPRTNECDHPSKVKCRRFDHQLMRRHAHQPYARYQNSQRQQQQIQCESGASGLYSHPYDCTKFLNCDHGRTFIQDCGPGTLFNDVFKVCDWPHKVDCGSRNSNLESNSNSNGNANSNGNSYSNGNANSNGNSYNGNQNSNGHTNGYTNNNNGYNQQGNNRRVDETYHGEGMIDMRSDFNNNNNQRYPTNDIRSQRRYPDSASTSTTQQSNNNLNSFTKDQSSFSSFALANDPMSINNPSFSLNPQNTLDIEEIPLESAFDASQQTITDQYPSINIDYNQLDDDNKFAKEYDTVSNQNRNRSGRIDEEFAASTNNQNTFFTKNVQSTVPLATNDRNDITNQFPQLNYLSRGVIEEFDRMYANSKPASTTTVKPAASTTKQPSKVKYIYPSGFETVGLQCEESAFNLNAHPYDCSKYVSCENGLMRVQSCEPGFMFNPTLKMCDFSTNVKTCQFTVEQSNPLEKSIEDEINEIHDENKFVKEIDVAVPSRELQPPEIKVPSTELLHQQNAFEEPSTKLLPPKQTPYFIPDMSVLPLAHDSRPKYPDEQPIRRDESKPSFQFNGKPSQGSDTEPETLEELNKRIEDIKARMGKDYNETNVITTTTPEPNIMKIPRGKEHSMPIYQRLTSTPISTTSTRKPSLSLPYNHIYYQPFSNPPNETELETDYIPISEALKLLLRPYINRNATKPSQSEQNSTKHVNKIENKILDIMDETKHTKTNRSKALEQDDLAAAVFNVNVAVKNLPDTPTESTPKFYIDITTEAKRFNEQDKSHRNHYNNHKQTPFSSPSSDSIYFPSDSIENANSIVSRDNDLSNSNKNRIIFPGPSNYHQVHPHGNRHPYHSSFYTSTTPMTTQTSYNTPNHHSHHNNNHNNQNQGPNYRSNAPPQHIGWLHSHGKNIESTTQVTASAPKPQLQSNPEKITTQTRLGDDDVELVSTCYGQFDCHNGICIPLSQVSGFD